jgi:hypothetical protein
MPTRVTQADTLAERVLRRLFGATDRTPLAIYADPISILHLRAARDRASNQPCVLLVGNDEEMFYGLRLRPSPRPGVWLIVEPKGDLPTEIELAPGPAIPE